LLRGVFGNIRNLRIFDFGPGEPFCQGGVSKSADAKPFFLSLFNVSSPSHTAPHEQFPTPSLVKTPHARAGHMRFLGSALQDPTPQLESGSVHKPKMSERFVYCPVSPPNASGSLCPTKFRR
jgi:hypothetical protein